MEAAADELHVAATPEVLVYTAITWRSAWKYRDRAYRYHYWDNGMIVGNALAEAAALGLPAHLVMGFVDDKIERLIGIDGERELALSMLTVGSGILKSPSPPPDFREIHRPAAPLSHSEVDYPSIRDMHRASSLVGPGEVALWRATPGPERVKEGTPIGETAIADSHRLEQIEGQESDGGEDIIALSPIPERSLPLTAIENVIERRASTRRFALKAIGYEELCTMLDRSTRGISADFVSAPESQMNDIYIIVNRVEGLSPGAYYYDRQGNALVLLKSGDFHQEAAHLVLDQDLGGDAGVTMFFMADLNPILTRLGSRGYRAVQMEAGIIGSRVYIAAYALGRGATGLTFYDDEVTEFFSPHAAGKSCMLALSTGVPGKRPLI